MKRLLHISFLLIFPFLYLNASCPEGHTVFLPDGSTEAFFCEGISDADILVRSDNRGFPKVYVMVDENGTIIYSNTSPRIPISGLSSGSYRIYGVVFMGRLQEVVGENIFEAKFSTFCHTISVNYIHVVLAEVEIGRLTYSDGAVFKEKCADPAIEDTLSLAVEFITGELLVVAVDEEGIIVGLFNDLAPVLNDIFSGSIKFYAIAYEGAVVGNIGDLYIVDELIDGCYDISQEVRLLRDVPNGGRLGFDGIGSFLWLCPGDSSLSEIEFAGTDASPLPYFIFAVNENGIIELVSSGNPLDLSGLVAGRYFFHGASSIEVPVLIAGDTFSVFSAFETDCVDWSSRSPELLLEDLDAGELNFSNYNLEEIFFCKGEKPDSIKMTLSVYHAPKVAIVVTNDLDEIIEILEGDEYYLSVDDQFKILIYGLAFSGNLLIKKGDLLHSSEIADGCYEFTGAPLSVVEDAADAGRLIHGFPDDSVSFCTGDGFSFFVNVSLETNSALPIRYVLTDLEGLMVNVFEGDSFDLEGLSPGHYQLYGMSIADPSQIAIGDTLSKADYECFDLSTDFLKINARRIDGGQVFFRGGQTEVRLCEKSGQDFKIRIFRNSASAKYTSVFTDEDNKLLLVSELDSINIGSLPIGKYRVWGIGHTVELELETGMDIFSYPLSADCFAISEKSLDLIIDEASGGLVELGGNAFSRTYCLDEVPDEWLELSSSSASELNYRFLLVDPQLRLIETLDTNWINLSDFDPGVYSIVGVSYGGNLLLQAGDLLINPPFGVSSDCHEFSSNNILVNIRDIAGGNISYAGGGSQKIVCPDGAASLLSFSNPPAGNYAFLLLDDGGILVDYTFGLELDVFDMDEGNYQIRGLAYLGNLILETGISIDSQDLSSVCHDFSENVLALTLVYPDGGEVTTDLGSDDIEIEIDPINPDTVFFLNNSVSSATYRYVITDTNDIVFAVMPIDYLIFNFTLFEEFRVYGISYTGNLSLGGGQQIHNATISDDCYSLSTNYVNVRLVDEVDDFRLKKEMEYTLFELRLTSGNPFSTDLGWEVLVNNQKELRAVNYSYQLFDLQGRLFKNGYLETTNGWGTVNWETSDLPTGMYILRVTDSKESRELKLFRK